MSRETKQKAVSFFVLVLIAACGGGGGPGPEGPSAPPPPAAPTVSAAPADAQAALTWSAVSGATSYNVYTSSTSPVTTASPKSNVATAGTTLSGLANGTPAFFAVSAVNAGGESALSNEVCAVPTAASTAGLTLYDSLCAGSLDGTKWQTPLFSRAVVNGAMVLNSQAANMERFGNRGLAYTTFAFVNAGSQRVTTLQASLTVPAATASRTGGTEIRANLRLVYQPPAARLALPEGQGDMLTLQVGLRDDGNGPRAFREVLHCDVTNCTARSSSGIAFSDPAGFGGEAPAAYDTTYVVTAALDESTGVFAWTIAGGGLNLSGTADPAAYLAGNTNWAALGPNPLANGGFLFAGPRTRLLDNTGGSSGAISARFDDVRVGFNNAAHAPWDDFSGAGGNSGPSDLSAAKWTNNPGEASMSLAGCTLTGHAHAITPTAATLQVFHSLVLADPATVNTIQADYTVAACSNTLSGTNRIGMAAAFYNDGTPGTTAPDINQPNSRVGDIIVSLFLDCTLGDVRFQVTRFDTNATQTILSNSANAVIPRGPAAVVGNTHTLRMKFDPATHLLTFQANGQAPVVVDPTTVNARMNTAAPFVKAANAPNKNLSWFMFFPNAASAGNTASVDFRANNVFTAP